ncbi:DUF11 domain-containing protein [Curtobacterium sp. MCBA15_001]|uniref:DUF11 domain-containing protein n=1 Tax=Curtobacterium sp. MCBA15_001 TaxID=1898731 RepID=UPI0008DD5341|nr:DUF11 domain-containing protein [Curtobacterium sp. MCBA15_001]OIH95112.1 hypothetical protein BIU90_02955 [Curtobacterium sp. MCBA15_001]
MYSTGDGRKADGLVMYLADGAAPAGVGAPGTGLGYTCVPRDNQGNGPCGVAGIPGGFAAVALDRYGNFSQPINGSGPGPTPDAVVVRGSGDGLVGYRYVAGAPAPGGVASAGATPRTVRVSLVPGAAGELFATVRLEDHGTMRTVLDRVPLHGDGQAPLPDTLRLGFAGATGSYVDVHEIDALRVWQPADLRVEHTLPPATAGAPLAYTVTASNVGVNDSTPSPLTVDVPDALHDVHWSCSTPDTCGDASGTGDVATDLTLPRGAVARIEVRGTVDPAATGTLDSRATIATAPHLADIDERDNVSVASAPVRAEAQLGTDKSVSPSTGVRPGDDLEYTVTAVNHGPAVAHEVTVVDDLPTPLAFVGSDDDCTAEGQHVTCRLTGDLAPDGTAAFRFHARLDPAYRGDGSDVVNTATASSPTDPDGGDPSPGVDIAVVDPDGPSPSPTPTAAPTAPPTPGAAGHATTGSGGGAGSNGQHGPLAYTGTEGLTVLATVGTVLLLAGAGLVWALRRRTRTTPRSGPVE